MKGDPQADPLDPIRDRFLAAWDVGARPRIEDYLGGAPGPARARLLAALLAAELGRRRARGERPGLDEYHARFPEHGAVVAAAFPPASATRNAWEEGRDTEIDPRGARPELTPPAGYRLIERLGRGGFGEVWKAEGPGGVPVALKFVRLLDAEGAVELRGFEMIKAIRHPNLMATFGAWWIDDRLVLGMELADGTLMDRLAQARAEGRDGIDGRELIEYVAEAARGIDFLNEHRHVVEDGRRLGIQHRDIKPQNILLVGGGVKVADFGLARLLERSATAHSGSLTPAYSAPEFFRNQTSDRSDQYSLAVAYCQLRGGRLPFAGTMAALVHGHLHEPPDLTMLPPRERPVVRRALAKDPAARWPDCRAFAAALKSAASGVSPWPRRAGLAVVLAVPLVVALASWPRRPGPPGPAPAHRGGAPPTVERAPTEPVEPVHVPPGELKAPAAGVTAGAPGAALAAGPAAVAVAPDEPRAPAADDLAACLERGERAYRAGDHDGAVIAYSEAIALDPANTAAINNRGNAYFKLGFHDAAIEDFDRAIQLAPGEPEAYFNRGTARYTLGRYDEATDDFNAALKASPTFRAAYINRGLAYQKRGDEARAAADFAAAERLGGAPP